MNDDKYELIDCYRNYTTFNGTHVFNIAVQQIRALKDFGNIKKGQVGGFIQSEKNLSQKGNCWVDKHCVVTGNVYIEGNTIIKNKSKLIFNELNKKIYIKDSIISNSHILADNKDSYIIQDKFNNFIRIINSDNIDEVVFEPVDKRTTIISNITNSNLDRVEIKANYDIGFNIESSILEKCVFKKYCNIVNSTIKYINTNEDISICDICEEIKPIDIKSFKIPDNEDNVILITNINYKNNIARIMGYITKYPKYSFIDKFKTKNEMLEYIDSIYGDFDLYEYINDIYKE